MNKFHQEKTILLIKGGISSERDVSLESGKCVEEALLRLGYHVVSFDMADGIFSLNQVIKDVDIFLHVLIMDLNVMKSLILSKLHF